MNKSNSPYDYYQNPSNIFWRCKPKSEVYEYYQDPFVTFWQGKTQHSIDVFERQVQEWLAKNRVEITHVDQHANRNGMSMTLYYKPCISKNHGCLV